jgi:site-specific DNA-methyltransferase (adenine-specific)
LNGPGPATQVVPFRIVSGRTVEIAVEIARRRVLLGLADFSVLARMTNSFSCEPFSILRGSAIDVLPNLPPVDCVVTSPPYYKQRTYGVNPSELGRESSLGEYIANLVNVFKSIPLATWGSIWVNIGDKRGKRGELLRIPHLMAGAMAEAGFFLIDEVVWAKESVRIDGTSIGQAMIEPALRRLNGNGHEPFYRFVLDPKKAWSDTCAVHIPRKNVADIRYLPEELMKSNTSLEGRNLGNVWNVPMGQTKESHYAVFPPALIERPIAMTCPLEISAEGPKSRIVQMVPYEEARPIIRGIGKYTKPEEETRMKSGRQDTGRQYIPRKPVTTGWEPNLPTIRRGIVFDPFTGAGTTGEVSIKLGRNFVGIELYENYAQIAEERCRQAHALRSTYEAENPMTPSTTTPTEAHDTVSDEVGGDVEMVNGAACS